jgi:hypothetical protein
LVEAHQAAYRDGYEQGFNAAANRPHSITVRYRHRTLRALLLRAIVIVVVLSFAITLIGSILR